MPTVNERCKILRSLNRVYVFEIVLLLVPRLKILRRRGLSYCRIFEKQRGTVEFPRNKPQQVLSTDSKRQQQALKHAKYISCGDGCDQENLSQVLSTSITRTFLATPLCTDIFDQDAEHNTYNHTLTLFESIHELHQKQIFLQGNIFLPVLDASLSPSDTIVWDYRPIFQKFIRYLHDITYIDTFKPFIFDSNNNTSPTPIKQASFNNPTGMMIITIDSSKIYSYRPPTHSPRDPHTTRLRIDVLKKHLNDGSRESAYDFINKSLQGKLHEEASIASNTADFQRAAFHKRPSPISKHPKDQDQEYFRFDIDCQPEEVEELASSLQQPHPLTSQCPTVFAFPFDLATHRDTFVASLRKGSPSKPPLEFMNQLVSIPRIDEFLKFPIVRTKYSILFHVDSNQIPSPSSSEISRLHWLTQLLWDAGLVLLYPSGKYTPNPRIQQTNTNPKKHTLTSTKAIVAETPAATTHIALAKTAAIFGEIDKIIPLDFSSMSIGTNLQYEITYTHSDSPVIAHGQEVTGISFSQGQQINLQKQQTLIQNKRDTTNQEETHDWSIIEQIGSDLGAKSHKNQSLTHKPPHEKYSKRK